MAALGAPPPLVRGGVRKPSRLPARLGSAVLTNLSPLSFWEKRPWTRHLSSSVLFRPLLLLPPLGPSLTLLASLPGSGGSPGCRPRRAASARKKSDRAGLPGLPGGDRKDRESCPHTGIPSPPASALGRRRATGGMSSWVSGGGPRDALREHAGASAWCWGRGRTATPAPQPGTRARTAPEPESREVPRFGSSGRGTRRAESFSRRSAGPWGLDGSPVRS